jgi:predicted Zn-dependent peptidase
LRSKCVAIALAAAIALGAASARAAAQTLAVERHTLSNGLVVLTHEDHSIPMVSLHVFYHVGSRNERPGITGVSHLFEHMMFNGSARYKPKMLDQLIESAGGGANAYTNNNVTAYNETFSRDALATVLDIEADRMETLLLTPTNIEQERGIVAEERRVSIDNDPQGSMYELLYATAFVAYPYHWSVLGWMGDIQSVKLDEAKKYFETYYGPNNATLILTGDFKTAELMKQVEATFGKAARRGSPEPVVNSEPEQLGERRVTLVKEASLPSVMIGFKAPEATHADAPALAVLESILNAGESSRLYQKLVYAQIATTAAGSYEAMPGPSLFLFTIQAQEGKTAEECERALYEVLRDVQTNGVKPEELQKAKNQLRATTVRSLQTISGKADLLGRYETTFGDYRALFTILDKYDAVTNDDIKRVAAAYFVKRHRTVVTLQIPKQGKEADNDAN